MKTTRFFSVFLAVALLMSLLCVPFARADEEPSLPEDLNVLAKAALLADPETDAVAYALNEHEELYPASLTKIMTALLVLEAVEEGTLTLDQEVTASSTAFEGLSSDGSNAGIKAGEVMSVENLLKCMLVVSANEACNILAEAVCGSVEAFVARMNERAAELGCENTHFCNPNGLHDPGHYTSAWDLYLMTKEAMKHDTFSVISDTANVIIPATNLSPERNYWTTNHLLSTWRVIGYLDKRAHGIKTGSTDAAGHCLVSSATQGSMTYISVILGAERVEENGVGNIRSFSETSRMFDYGFENFTYKTILQKSEPIKDVTVTLSKTDHVALRPAKDIEALMPKGLDAQHLERTVTLDAETVEAPVEAGQKLGTLTLSYDGTVYGTVDLLAMNAVEASKMMVFWRDVQAFFAKTSTKVVLILLVVLVVALLLWKLVFGRRRYRYGRSVSRRGGGGYRGRKRRY
ncbi:MAG: D-alanyl-D-alanine carboxypeptidase [Oscillibacter sp.]|nr:D-alanyl-D-alanine carboxypeptidase [Oscillibacter sp.]